MKSDDKSVYGDDRRTTEVINEELENQSKKPSDTLITDQLFKVEEMKYIFEGETEWVNKVKDKMKRWAIILLKMIVKEQLDTYRKNESRHSHSKNTQSRRSHSKGLHSRHTSSKRSLKSNRN